MLDKAEEELFKEFETVDPSTIHLFMEKHPNDYDFPYADYSEFKAWFLNFQKEWNEVCTNIDKILNVL